MKSNKTLKHWKKLLKYVEYYNIMTSFPFYDTSWVEDIRNLIKSMEDNNKVNYDDEPVVACKYCKSLHIRDDEDDNSICFRCGATNDLIEFKNIFEYEKFINKNK